MIKKMFVVVLTGALLLLAPATGGAATPTKATPVTGALKGKTAPSVCRTDYRGMPAYDRQCLTTGTARDAYLMWLSPAQDRRENLDNRRYVCRLAQRMGVMAAARDFYFDGAYDRFRNHGDVLRVLGYLTWADCRMMGYRV